MNQPSIYSRAYLLELAPLATEYPFLKYSSGVAEKSHNKTSLLITSSRAKNSKTGLNLRLKTIERILKETNFHVEVKTIQQVKNDSNFRRYDLCVIHSTTPLFYYSRIKKYSPYIWFDCTDSIIKMRLLGLGRNRVLSQIKGFFEICLTFLLRRKFLCITYISKQDMFWDKFIFRAIPKFVFGNNVIDVSPMQSANEALEIYFVGDTTYNANRKAIKFIEKRLSKFKTNRKLSVTIVSQKFPNDVEIFLRNGHKIRYQRNVLAEKLYRENAIHISPIWNSLGIKNKVYEPAYLGLKVFGAAASFNGLIMKENMRSTNSRSDFFPQLIKFIDEPKIPLTHRESILQFDETQKFSEFLKSLKNS
jgi:hypothetical protein